MKLWKEAIESAKQKRKRDDGEDVKKEDGVKRTKAGSESSHLIHFPSFPLPGLRPLLLPHLIFYGRKCALADIGQGSSTAASPLPSTSADTKADTKPNTKPKTEEKPVSSASASASASVGAQASTSHKPSPSSNEVGTNGDEDGVLSMIDTTLKTPRTAAMDGVDKTLRVQGDNDDTRDKCVVMLYNALAIDSRAGESIAGPHIILEKGELGNGLTGRQNHVY